MPARILLILGLLMLVADAASARQHLVSAATDWQLLDDHVKPGDEIILMPGSHRPAELHNLQGTADQRITIRGLDEDHPALIEAGRYGLRLHDPRWLIIKDLKIEGAAVTGLVLDRAADQEATRQAADAQGGASPATGSKSPTPGHILLQRVAIHSTGPTGKRHALELNSLVSVRIEDCRFDAWAGSAIEIAACEDVQIRRCTFTGRDDHSQTDGVRVWGGSDRVLVDQCMFHQAAARCIVMGADDDLTGFHPAVSDDAKAGSVIQARRVTVTRNVIRGGGIPLFLAHADSCMIRNNTIVRPSVTVIAVDDTSKDATLASTRGTVVGANLIVWQAGDIRKLAEVVPSAGPECLVLEENLWWSTESAEERASLGPLPVTPQWPQVMDLDPQLDDDLKPTNDAAELFGAHAP